MNWRVNTLPKRQLWAVRVSSAVSMRQNARNIDQKPFTRSQEYSLAAPLHTFCTAYAYQKFEQFSTTALWHSSAVIIVPKTCC